MILCAALVRATTTAARVPWWDLDPLMSWIPESTRTPAFSLALDAMVWVAVALILIARRATSATDRFPWRSGLLLLAGFVPAAAHSVWLPPFTADPASATRGDFQSLLIASAWSAALAGAWALTVAARERRLRTLVLAVLVTASVPLAFRGLSQYHIEHPRLVASFEADREARLAAVGIEPGSQAAAIYERRLRQPEATGWFGFSNVFGTIIAAAFVALLALSVAAIRAAKEKSLASGDAGVICLAAMLAGVTLAHSGSKGAIAAASFGVVLLAFPKLWRRLVARKGVTRPAVFSSLFVVFVIACPIAAVFIRGSLGEQLSERSIYFRSQYAHAAAAIFAENPLTGVGPAFFKDAYMLAKDPTNPEEVESPHSLFFDWTATLGVMSLAWVALVLHWLVRAARRAVYDHSQAPGPVRVGTSLLPLLLIIAATVSVMLVIEREALSADLLLLLLTAAAVWILAARSVHRLLAIDGAERPEAVALFATAGATASHAMIEITPVFPGSAALFFTLLALGGTAVQSASPSMITPDSSTRTQPCVATIAFALASLLIAGFLGFRSARTYDAESHLYAASTLVRDSVTSTDAPPDLARLRAALALLDRASPVFGPALVEHQTSLAWRIALIERDPTARDSALADALSRVRRAADERPRSSTAHSRVASMLEAAAAAFQRPELRRQAAVEWERTAAFDPNGLIPAFRAAICHRNAGNLSEARRWAQRAFEIDAALRLDPIKQLTPEQRADIMGLIP